MANVDDLTKASLGQYGSTYLTDAGELDLSGTTATMYIIAITILNGSTTFAALETLDGRVGKGISTVTAENDLDGTQGIGAGGNGTDWQTGFAISEGLTIYGQWDKITLGSTGDVIVYFAPRGY
jgi:hypothetical protein